MRISVIILYTFYRAYRRFTPSADHRAQVTLARNFAGHSNAYIHRLAVGRGDGKGRFALASHSEISHLSNDPFEGNEIDVVTIDRFVLDKGLSITGIKIDVEGSDIDVLKGGLATLESQSPLVLTEARPEDRLFALVNPLGYRVFAFTKKFPARGFTFEEIPEKGNCKTKMLFLVPRRLHPRYEALASPQRSGFHPENDLRGQD